MSVAVMPRLLMTVIAAGRNEIVQNGRQVMLQSWFELNRTDRRRAPNIENVDRPRLDSGGVHDRGHLLGEVVDIAVPFRGDRKLLLIAHELEPPKIFPCAMQSLNIHGRWHAKESAESRTMFADFFEVEIIKAHLKRKMAPVGPAGMSR